MSLGKAVNVFENHINPDRQNRGHIICRTVMRIWDLEKKEWSQLPPVTHRMTLTGVFFPNRPIVVGALHNAGDDGESDIQHLADFTPPNSSEVFSLDIASNSRAHGHFIYTVTPIGPHYLGDGDTNWKRIIYGSLLLTTCKQIKYFPSVFIITDDTQRPDDPKGGKDWQTGDSHGKVASDIAETLNLGLVQSEDADNPTLLAYQFRLAIHHSLTGMTDDKGRKLGILGKGTLAHNNDMDDNPDFVDMAVPLSSFKAYKPALSAIIDVPKLVVGTVFESEHRQADTNWQFLQWFTWEDLKAEGLVDEITRRAAQLRDMAGDNKALAKVLRLEAFSEFDAFDESQGRQTYVGYVSDAMRVIAADKDGRLLMHPYLVQRIKEHTQEMWLRIARTACIIWHSLMVQPDESLTLKKDPDGKIVERVCCARSLPEGEYIVFCSPTRHWGDIQLWQNKHIGLYAEYGGVVAACTELAATMGRDFDGDFVSLVRADLYPHFTNRIRGTAEPPKTQKFPKWPLGNNLKRLALGQMETMTGITALYLAKAVDLGPSVYNARVTIPADGADMEPEYPKKMRIIDFLSQQVQIAVDSMKSAYPNNERGIKRVGAYIERAAKNRYGIDEKLLSGSPKWWYGLKNSDTYLLKPCPVDPPPSESLMNQLCGYVNGFWTQNMLMEKPPESFQETLFKGEPITPYQEKRAKTLISEYRDMMKYISNAVLYKDETGGIANGDVNRRLRSIMIQELVRDMREVRNDLPTVDPDNDEPLSGRSWAAAFWWHCHSAKTGTAGLVFTMFPSEIITELEYLPHPSRQFRVIATQHGYFTPIAPDILDGEYANIEVIRADYYNYKDSPTVVVRVDGEQHSIGVVSPDDNVDIGEKFSALLYSYRWNPPDNKTSSIWVFPESTHPQVIKETLWIRNLVVPNAQNGAWAPLEGKPWQWDGKVISPNTTPWRWGGQIFEIRCLADGRLEAMSASAKQLVGWLPLGMPANHSLRALWRGAELPMKAYSVQVNRTRHEIALFSADMPDDKCRAELGI